MRRLLITAITAWVSLMASPVSAGGVEAQEGRILTATGNVYLRDGYPSGLFYTKGRVLGVVQPGEKVRVVGEKSVWAVFGSHRWIQVERLSANAKPNEKFGWVYAGEPEQPLFTAR